MQPSPIVVAPVIETWLISSTPLAQNDIGSDETKWADPDAFAKNSARLDDGARMDDCRHPATLGDIIAEISASATSAPATLPSQAKRQMLPRFFSFFT